MDVPPAVDSPNNILNALDNHCIQAIFSHLKTRENFFNVARTCTRFQANAIRCFPPNLRVISIGAGFEKREDMIPKQCLYRFLSIFGPLIKEIHWFASGNPATDGEIIETIGQFCGATLNGFNIHNFNSKFPKKWKFTALERLTLDHASAKKFKYHSKLKYLKQIKKNPDRKVKQALRIRRYPQLEHLVLLSIDTLTYDRFIQFLILNPQLRKLDLFDCKHINISIIKDIANYLPNIERFGFDPHDGPFPHSDWTDLGRLRHLKSFQTIDNISFKSIIDLFSEFNVPVEHLSLNLADDISHDFEDAQKLKSFKRMGAWFSGPGPILRLIKTQPSLEEIVVYICRPDVNIDFIKEVFFHGKNLTKLSIHYVIQYGLVILDKQAIALDCGRIVNVEVVRSLTVHTPRLDIPTALNYICRLQSTQS